MSIYPASSKLLLSSNYYSLNIKKYSYETNIKMALSTDYFHTRALPRTLDVLEEALPGILKSRCFNDSNIPFHQEVLNTEIGHLFEHILLEYLCETKIKGGYKKAFFKGVTTWNWRHNPIGTFSIKIYMQPEDFEFLNMSLKKTILLLNRIIREKESSLGKN